MSQATTCTDTTNVTSSPESADGLTLCNSLDGEAEKSGLALHRASHSVAPVNNRAWTMPATYGPLFGGSSRSANLQSCLENRLQARLPWNGLTALGMKWKRWDMPSGRSLSRLAVSDYISGDAAGILLPTPRASKRGPRNPDSAKASSLRKSKNAMNKIEDYLCVRAGKTGYPNPEYLLWLMGFPACWMQSLVRATQSVPRSPSNLSGRANLTANS